jgi:hypothetical protein
MPTRRIAPLAPAAALAVLALALALPGAAGAKLVYRCGANLCQSNDDGSAQKQITTDGRADPAAPVNNSFFGPDLSADGTKVSFFRQDETRGAFVIDLRTGARTTIGSGTPDDVQMRPDGGRVAVDEFGASEISPAVLCYYDATGGGQSCEAPGGAFGIDYRPDGRLVSLVPTGDRARHVKLCLRFADGSGRSGCEADLVVDDSRYFEDPAVSPDGRQLAVTLKSGPDDALGSIGIYDLTSGTFLRQVSSGAQDNDPAWTSDGRHVVFARGRNSDAPALWSVAPTGSPGSEKLIVKGGVEPTGGAGSVGGAAASHAKVKSRQRGDLVKGTLTVGFDGSTVAAKLVASSKSLAAGAAGAAGAAAAAARSVTVGKLTRRGVAAGRLSLKVKLNAQGRKALRARGRLKLKLVMAVSAPGGSKTTIARSVTLRR